MKKVLFILLGILCAVSAGAVSYASPYRGSGRGVIYTMSSPHNSAAFAGLAQAPVVSMGSVSSASTMGATRSANAVQTMGTAMTVAQPVKGIYTAATAVSGGVTTYEAENENSYTPASPHKNRGIRKGTWDGKPAGLPDCGCDWEQIDEERWQCTKCGAVWNEFNNLIETPCACGTGTCNCSIPLDFNWGAMLFMAVMAAAYAVWKRRTA